MSESQIDAPVETPDGPVAATLDTLRAAFAGGIGTVLGFLFLGATWITGFWMFDTGSTRENGLLDAVALPLLEKARDKQFAELLDGLRPSFILWTFLGGAFFATVIVLIEKAHNQVPRQKAYVLGFSLGVGILMFVGMLIQSGLKETKDIAYASTAGVSSMLGLATCLTCFGLIYGGTPWLRERARSKYGLIGASLMVLLWLTVFAADVYVLGRLLSR